MPGEHHDVGRFGPLLSTVAVPFLIAVGGFVGANLRYVLGAGLPGLAGTLVANAFGTLLAALPAVGLARLLVG